MSIKIEPLQAHLKEDYLSFFESVDFQEHPHWADCYCYSFHFTGGAEDWQRDRNKACVSAMIDEGTIQGYLAYQKNKVVAWCNVNNRLNYQLLTKSYDLINPANAKICSIVCFTVHQDYRRQGIMQLLLSRIVSDYTAQAYEFIEAYPKAGVHSSEKLYRGPVDFYIRNGFKVAGENQVHLTVRLSL